MNFIFSTIYDFLNNTFYSYMTSPGDYSEIVVGLLAGCLTLFALALPFIIVWHIIKRFLGR